LENYRGLYYQTLHENKLIGGYLSRYPSESLTSLNQIEREIENKNTTSLNSMFKNLEVDYIVVYKDYQTKKNEKWQQILSLLDIRRIYEDNFHSIYKIS